MSANRMHGPGAGMNVAEKSKRGIAGILRELFAFSPKLKLPMAAALLLAIAGTVLTIIGPDQLSRMTDLISEALFARDIRTTSCPEYISSI